jgi:hypothetical protein
VHRGGESQVSGHSARCRKLCSCSCQLGTRQLDPLRAGAVPEELDLFTRYIALRGRRSSRCREGVLTLGAFCARRDQGLYSLQISVGPDDFSLSASELGFCPLDLTGAGSGPSLSQAGLGGSHPGLMRRYICPGGGLEQSGKSVTRLYRLTLLYCHCQDPGRHLGRNVDLDHLDRTGGNDSVGFLAATARHGDRQQPAPKPHGPLRFDRLVGTPCVSAAREKSAACRAKLRVV